MKKLTLLLPVFALAACGEEPAPEPTPTETATPEPVSTLPAPDQDLFKSTFAETCEGAEPVNKAVCRRAMGAETVACEFGLGEDEYLRHKATLAVNEANDGWMLADAEALCAEHGAHHSAN
ncbi:hypothetical protein [Qipengyuania vesicularis]|uniref:hypothetical protein n=1 Tax=Qipengyuania vesicularis TaxID=2867232 RepID=UPI001C87A9BA|nr:hypothetical protein [Qipengyuania vesicularis]